LAALAAERPAMLTALREVGLLDLVETAVAAAGGRVRDAWNAAAEWDRGNDFRPDLSGAVHLNVGQVDQMFRRAAAIKS
jgi:hypothetical protein